ncbi:MAG: cob(I)yrinic acid a,c-diamide adenosyltransferase [Candidatus Omnitrophica bacterium]|nr:cob(I)yrinic acid a,c-diamide adenosyltransferase [Candidatus Omnitrophota bacterium]
MIQVYTGNGKGKTTAALGLALRAAGRGLRVHIIQFLKKGCYGETIALKKFKNVTLRQFGSGSFVSGKASSLDKKRATDGLRDARRALLSGEYQVIILDEVNAALSCGALCAQELCALLEEAPSGIELILTGRNAPSALLRKADLITVMQASKHYYRKGVKGRKGIEF